MGKGKCKGMKLNMWPRSIIGKISNVKILVLIVVIIGCGLLIAWLYNRGFSVREGLKGGGGGDEDEDEDEGKGGGGQLFVFGDSNYIDTSIIDPSGNSIDNTSTNATIDSVITKIGNSDLGTAVDGEDNTLMQTIVIAVGADDIINDGGFDADTMFGEYKQIIDAIRNKINSSSGTNTNTRFEIYYTGMYTQGFGQEIKDKIVSFNDNLEDYSTKESKTQMTYIPIGKDLLSGDVDSNKKLTPTGKGKISTEIFNQLPTDGGSD